MAHAANASCRSIRSPRKRFRGNRCQYEHTNCLQAQTRALKRLTEHNYSVFVRDIQRVGYEKRTSKRNVFFNPVYQIDETTFDVRVDSEGRPVVDEEFTETLSEFRRWALGQEETLQRLFLKED